VPSVVDHFNYMNLNIKNIDEPAVAIRGVYILQAPSWGG
jgi:hypothetical protein